MENPFYESEPEALNVIDTTSRPVSSYVRTVGSSLDLSDIEQITDQQAKDLWEAKVGSKEHNAAVEALDRVKRLVREKKFPSSKEVENDD